MNNKNKERSKFIHKANRNEKQISNTINKEEADIRKWELASKKKNQLMSRDGS